MSLTLPFVKMHGLGNDFVLMDFRAAVSPPGGSILPDFSGLARQLCSRRYGIGADGLLICHDSRVTDLGMRIFNPDGSEAEMCGNGIRCLAKYAYEHDGILKTELGIETLAGIMTVSLVVEAARVTRVAVDMGQPAFEAVGVPLQAGGDTFSMTALSMGNPHCVIAVDDLSAVDLETLGPLISHLPRFPRLTNVEFVQVVAPDHLRVRVWERGAGATLACGTGACAALAALARQDLSRRRAAVDLPGGSLQIEWRADGHVIMTGPATLVFRGEFVYESV